MTLITIETDVGNVTHLVDGYRRSLFNEVERLKHGIARWGRVRWVPVQRGES